MYDDLKYFLKMFLKNVFFCGKNVYLGAGGLLDNWPLLLSIVYLECPERWSPARWPRCWCCTWRSRGRRRWGRSPPQCTPYPTRCPQSCSGIGPAAAPLLRTYPSSCSLSREFFVKETMSHERPTKLIFGWTRASTLKGFTSMKLLVDWYESKLCYPFQVIPGFWYTLFQTKN